VAHKDNISITRVNTLRILDLLAELRRFDFEGGRILTKIALRLKR
jgi:hypothetical protein